MFVPLARMPLNPNGKIDKPTLPFPDTAQASFTAQNTTKNTTEHSMQIIWAKILPNPPKPIPTDESFFDLGGHSILATRLIFEIRKIFIVDAPLGLIFEEPTISGLVTAVERIRNRDLGIATKEPSIATHDVNDKPPVTPPLEYGQDYLALRDRLDHSYPSPPEKFAAHPVTVFLTGATGFLGVFILQDLLSRIGRVKKVICLIRAPTVQDGVARLKEGAIDRGIWHDDWLTSQRLEVVVGDLSLESFGLDDNTWKRISEEADAILHNGALVHWVYPYEKLRAPNVLATLTSIKLASLGKPKFLVFVSSTSAIDTGYYVELSEQLVRSPSGVRGVLEADDLEGARADLKTGYGQSKWVSEKLLFEAGKRGLRGHIVRPGYVVGHSQTAGRS